MKPGATTRPSASITLDAGPEILPTSTIFPSLSATSARRAGAPVPSTTVPFLISNSELIWEMILRYHRFPPQEPITGEGHDDQGRRQAARRQADGVPGIRLGDAVRDAAEGSERRGRRQGQEDRDLRPAGRLHPDLLGQARAGLSQEPGQAQVEGRERSLVRGRERRLRDGALGQGPRSEERRG